MNLNNIAMKVSPWCLFSVAFLAAVSIMPIGAQTPDPSVPALPAFHIERTRGATNNDPMAKLSPELLALYEQFEFPKRSALESKDSLDYTSSQLATFFGIVNPDSDPLIFTSIVFNKVVDLSVFDGKRATVIARTGNTVYVMLPVRTVGTIADSPSVARIGVLKAFNRPTPLDERVHFDILPIERSSNVQSIRNPLANDFDKQLLTGRGVIIGIIDSGIDWKHDDFRKADGSSRVLAIWDLTDDSYQISKGRIGSAPPIYVEKTKSWLGTVYTNDQINEALRGRSTVNSVDKDGHGTAVAGAAASNGRATARGVATGTYSGVATEADLVIVRVSECGGLTPAAPLTANWIMETAKRLGKPVVVNLSFGNGFSSRDGGEYSEEFLDSLVGPTRRGAIVTVSAGNDARFNSRAGGRFAPKRSGQADQFSKPVELNVASPSRVIAVFDKSDDWGIAFRSTNPSFLDTNGKQAAVFVVKNNRRIEFRTSPDLLNPSAADPFISSIRPSFSDTVGKADTVQMQFPVGNYILWGFGTTANVSDGRFDLYIADPSGNGASFGTGTLKTEMVASPGNAKHVITVGSYDFRDRWVNLSGETTRYNLVLGAVSDYSSPGFRRDGLVKPDIAAPGRYTISSLSQFAHPDSGGCRASMAADNRTSITRDGFHIAWSGTSASTPFVTGLIALMLQKNPNLDSEQVRSLLKRTARSGNTVGAVPNPIWGWGMLDPAAALRATPAKAQTSPVRRPR